MKTPSVDRFLNSGGQVQQWPTKHRDKQLVLDYLITKFEDRSYTEREVNEVLKSWHTFQDWPLLRRELYESGFLSRDAAGTDYRKLMR